MKKLIKTFAVFLVCAGAFGPSAAFGQELSGVVDSTFNYIKGAGDAEAHSFGLEEYANLRLRMRAGEKAVLNAAVNLIALSGTFAQGAAALGMDGLGTTPVLGKNYAAALELERLYFRINGDYVDTEAGLFRINFGYGQVWGSSDFLNPRNPLSPNARPRGVLGAAFSFYPADSLKLMAFAAAPKNCLESGGGGFIPGLSLDQHWDRVSLQALYAFETPDITKPGIHRFGLSLKADLELGFVAEALYTLNSDDPEGLEGLSAGAGFDYNFFDGDLYILAEYLFNGSSSSTAWGFGGTWMNHHYLYGSALYRFNDFSSLSLATVFCFDDLSFSPFVTFNYEVFQGFSLNLSARLLLDQKTLSNGKAGELGPIPPNIEGFPGTGGTRLIVNAGARFRF